MFHDLLSTIGTTLLTVVVPAVVTAVGGLLVVLLKTKLQQAGIELTKAQTDRVNQVVEGAIRATEEAARRRAASPVEPSMSPAEKQLLTIDKVVAILPELPTAEITDAIDAQLPVVRKAVGVPPVVPPIDTTVKEL